MPLFEPTKALALSLTRIRSVTGEPGEREVIRSLHDYFKNSMPARRGTLTLHEVVPPGDPLQRPFLLAHLRGDGKRAVLFMGHVDTVGTADYGELEPLATDPEALTAAIAKGAMGSHLAAIAASGRYLFGRGLLDMKAGVAANAVALLALADVPSRPHVLFAATADEEVNSHGVKGLRRWLVQYAKDEGLDLIGCINTDYTTALYDGDPARHVYLGSIGKTLPAITVRGLTSHVGEPQYGLDPDAIIAAAADRLIYNLDLADHGEGETGPAPVALHLGDDKRHYDTQTAVSATLTLNMLSLSRSPTEQLELVRRQLEAAVKMVLNRRNAAVGRAHALDLPVLTFAEAIERAKRAGHLPTLKRQLQMLPGDLDLRESCRRAALMALSAAVPQGPAAILYFATGLIPRVDSGKRVEQIVKRELQGLAATLGEQFSVATHFPYISDLSFLASSPDEHDSGFFSNFPATSLRPVDPLPPLELPVINPGTYGFSPHKADERLDVAYSFGHLPEVVKSLALGLGR